MVESWGDWVVNGVKASTHLNVIYPLLEKNQLNVLLVDQRDKLFVRLSLGSECRHPFAELGVTPEKRSARVLACGVKYGTVCEKDAHLGHGVVPRATARVRTRVRVTVTVTVRVRGRDWPKG